MDRSLSPPSLTEAASGLEPEWLDRPDLPADEAARALADLERVHRWLLGRWAVRRAVGARLPALAGTWLDLGAGSGHVGASTATWAGRRHVRLEVVAVDRRLAHLLAGRRQGHVRRAVVAEVQRLPFADGAVDVAFSHLLLHHFSLPAGHGLLTEMARVSRRAVVAVDLRHRAWLRWGARFALWLLRLGPTAYHDGLVSVDRAWALDEVSPRLAGGERLELAGRFPGRFSLVWWKA